MPVPISEKNKHVTAVAAENLTKKFKDFTAVDNISFSVPQGTIFAFLGPNGAGKSTTIKILTTILHPTQGKAIVCGFDALTQSHQARQQFGIVFQDPSVDEELTAYENMELHAALYNVPKAQVKPKIEELLTFVELWDRKNSLVKTFSGGMKRRLEIARGLLHEPKVLFLDEPTIGLDPQTRNHLWERLKQINAKTNITVFFTTHYMDEAEKMADEVAIIDHGKIIDKGTPQELMKRTKTKTLEAAFIKLTGSGIRHEEAGAMDRLRMQRKMFRR